MDPYINFLIEHLDLKPLEFEGGLFIQSYLSPEVIPQSALPSRYRSDKPFGTAIYFLLTDEPDSFSMMHRLPTDEIYHHYIGDPVELLLLLPDGSHEIVVLGKDLPGGQKVQHVVPRDTWQGSRLLSGGKYALLGTTMAPGFDVTDFIPGSREELIKLYPQARSLINALTRE